MTPERWQLVQRIFQSAIEREPQVRTAFLDQACAGDPALRLEVESLISSHHQTTNIIETMAIDVAAQMLADDRPDLVLGRSIGPYKVISHIGHGGMGEVYVAQDTRLGRQVVLKLLRDEFTKVQDHLRRFEQEARAASALNHPNIVTIHDIGEAEVGRFIIMELIEGQTLREVAGKPLSLDALMNLGGQIAKALNVAHTAGIIHRDIKPENIMVRNDGYVKVLDFGIARLATTSVANLFVESGVVETEPGIIIGTVAYMSPEQASGKTIASATDIFSLGIILYELATSRHPFKRDSQVACLHAIISGQPIAPSRLNAEISPALETLILRMLEKDPRLRPDASEVDRTLAEIDKATSKSAGIQSGLGSDLGRGLMLSVAGEAGIGKTTLVEDYLAELAADTKLCTIAIARGRCSERLAGTEAYLPFLEMLESLLHGDARQSCAHAMRLFAPAWYIQIAPLSADDSSAARIMSDIKVSSQERMKREMVVLLQQISRE